MYRLSLESIQALLRPQDVITACGIDARQYRRAYRLRTCSGCNVKPARGGAAIYQRRRDGSWRWTHHGHECGGDMIDLVAAAERIDRKTEFPKLLARCAQIAGIVASDPNLEKRIADRIAADRAERAREAIARDAAITAMPSVYESLAVRSLVGERYLQGRGIDPAALRAQGDLVRYTTTGEIAVPIRDLATGAIVGIQYRTPHTKGFRTEPYSETSGSALVGRLAEIDRDGVDVAVIVEGLADTLAARLTWLGCAVFGAAGAGHLDTITEAVAPKIAEIKGWLLIVVDDDDVGVAAAADAIVAAGDAGLVIDRDLHVVELGEHHDLADAYAAGWRHRWPTQGRAS